MVFACIFITRRFKTIIRNVLRASAVFYWGFMQVRVRPKIARLFQHTQCDALRIQSRAYGAAVRHGEIMKLELFNVTNRDTTFGPPMLTWWIDSHLNNKTKVFDETVFFLSLPSVQTIKNQFTASSSLISQLSCLPDSVYIFLRSLPFPTASTCAAAHHRTAIACETKRNRLDSWKMKQFLEVAESGSRVSSAARNTRVRTLRCRFLFLCNSSKEKEEETNRSGIDTQAARSVGT